MQVRLVEAAVKGPGWGVPEDVLRLLPGPAFEVEQALDDKGLPCERPISDKKRAGEEPAGDPSFKRLAVSCSNTRAWQCPWDHELTNKLHLCMHAQALLCSSGALMSLQVQHPESARLFW